MASFSVRCEIISLLSAQQESELIPEMAHTESVTDMDRWLDIVDILKAQVDEEFSTRCPPESNLVPDYGQVPLAQPEVAEDPLPPQIFFCPTQGASWLKYMEEYRPPIKENPVSMGPSPVPARPTAVFEAPTPQSTLPDSGCQGLRKSKMTEDENPGSKRPAPALHHHHHQIQLLSLQTIIVVPVDPTPLSEAPKSVGPSTVPNGLTPAAGSKQPVPAPVGVADVGGAPVVKHPAPRSMRPAPGSKRPAPAPASKGGAPDTGAPTAFSLFKQQRWEKVKAELHPRNPMVLNAVLQKRWERLSEEEKGQFQFQAVEAERIFHQRKSSSQTSHPPQRSPYKRQRI